MLMSELLEDLKDGVLTLTLNRPEVRNATNASLSGALQDALGRAAEDAEVRCVALTGAGKYFCAGGDVGSEEEGMGDVGGEGADLEAAYAATQKTIREGMDMCRMLHEIPKPTVALLNGPAAGAGFALAVACDLRFCLDTAKLTTAFVKLGLSGDCGGAYFLSQIVGAAKAKELYFSADVVTGREALELGLVTKVASAETFEQESRAYVEHLASLPTVAIGYMKQNFNAAATGSLSLKEIFDLEAENIVRCMRTEDHKAAAAAFVNKQPVEFKGR